MRYGLVIEAAVIEVIGAVPEIQHDLFTMACLDIGADPHGLHGITGQSVGHINTRTWRSGAWGPSFTRSTRRPPSSPSRR